MSVDLARLFAQVDGRPRGEAARMYADAGLAVFPCVPDKKRPLTGHGLLDATTDPARIAQWWGGWPDANIGLVTGHDGFDVLDIDRRPAGSGFPALRRARRQGLADGWLVAVRTPSRGLHLYYPALPDRPQRSWALPGIHIDFRGAGGYVVAPPSTVTGPGRDAQGYRPILARHDPAPLDATELRSLLDPRHPRRPAPRPERAHRPGDGMVAWLAARPEGNRNNALFWAACRYAEAAIPQPDALQVLGEAASRAGLPAKEITATIHSAYRTTGPRPSSGHGRSSLEVGL